MTEFAYEPFVILERGGTPETEVRPVRRPTTIRGRKPAILIVDREGNSLDLPLAAAGFEVYRTTGRESAQELLRVHPAILMALVRMSPDAVEIVRELRAIRPGLWIGLWGDPADRERATQGYAAGAPDLLSASADAQETVDRLVRSLPWATRLQEAADRMGRRRSRRLSPVVRRVIGSASALLLGIGLAAVVREWHDHQDAWTTRLDRFLSAMEPVRSASDPGDRQFNRWSRYEQLNLLREQDYALRSYYVEQLELQRARDAMWTTPPPKYSSR